MITTASSTSLAVELTRIAHATPGVTAIYPPVRAVSLLDVAQLLFAEVPGSSAIGRVIVDESAQTVSVSVGIDSSAPAGRIIRALCARFEECLHQSSGMPMSIKISIAYIHS